MRRSAVLAFVTATTLGTAALAQDYPTFSDPPDDVESGLWFRRTNVGYGPFRYVSMALFTSLRSGFETNFPESMPEGRFDFRVTESWVKNSSLSDSWRVDYEVLRTNLGFSWAVSDEVRLDLTIESASRTGGTLDAFILGFHQAFGLSIGHRDNFARNENRIELQPPDGGPPIVVDKSDPQPYEQAAILTLRDTVTYGNEVLPALAWSLSVRGYLTQGDVHRSGPFDVGASVGLVKEFETVHLYAGANVAWFGREEFFGLKLKTTQWSATFAVEWHLASDLSLIAHYTITSGAGERLDAFSVPCHEILGGFKFEPWVGVLFEFALVENIINPDNSPDFGVHAGVTFRW